MSKKGIQEKLEEMEFYDSTLKGRDPYGRSLKEVMDYAVKKGFANEIENHIYSMKFNLCLSFLRRRSYNRILVVGCGSGMEAEFLSKRIRFRYLIGLDISRLKVISAIRRAKIRGFSGKSDFLIGDGECLPFLNGTFDLGFIFESLHHMPQPFVGLRQLLGSCSEVLVVSEPIDAGVEKTIRVKVHDPLWKAHESVIGSRGFHDVFKKMGFQIIEELFYYSPIEKIVWNLVYSELSGALSVPRSSYRYRFATCLATFDRVLRIYEICSFMRTMLARLFPTLYRGGIIVYAKSN